MKFEHHTEIRQAKKVCREKDKKVIENLKTIFKDDINEAPFDIDDVIKASGIINVNAFSSTKLEDECSSRRVRRRVT